MPAGVTEYSSSMEPSRRKLAAFLAIAGRAGIEVAGAVERTMFSLEAGHAAATRLVSSGITGARRDQGSAPPRAHRAR
jgi:hypothetical protein